MNMRWAKLRRTVEYFRGAARADQGSPASGTARWSELAQQVAKNYPPSKHQHRVGELFPGKVSVAEAGHPVSARPAILVCFTNRSGSNYLAQLLETTGEITRAREFFNAPFITKLSEKHGLTSFPQYCQHISEAFRSEGRTWASKVSLDQLILLLRTGIIPEIYDPVRFVFIQRRDLLQQAISFSIAAQTQRWTALQQEAGHEPEFDPNDILRRLGGLSKKNVDFNRLLTVLGPPVHVVYEDLCADPIRTTQRITDELALGSISPEPDKCTVRIQRTEINHEFKNRMLALQPATLDAQDT